MKRMFRCDWKAPLLCIAVILIFFIREDASWNRDLDMLIEENAGYIQMLEDGTDVHIDYDWVLNITACNQFMTINNLAYSIEHKALIVLLVIMCFRFVRYFMEWKECGRCFIATLPVRKKERILYQFLTEAGIVIPAMLGGTAYLYFKIRNAYEVMNMELPYLFNAAMGKAIGTAIYIICILSVLLLVETVFVNGLTKTACSVAVLFIAKLTTGKMLNSSLAWRKVYQFLRFEVGEYQYEKNYEGISTWMHGPIEYNFVYNGESCTKLLEPEEELNKFGSLFDCGNMYKLLPYVAGYLLLTVVCIVCATALFKRQELSRKGFYFDKAIYVVSGVIALFFFMIVLGAAGNGQNPVSIIYKCVLLVASVLIFVLLTYRFKKNC